LEKPNGNGWMPLNLATYNGHLEVVKLLLDNGADLAVRDKYGATSLNCASANGHLEVVKLLLDKGADISVRDKYEATPLNCASANGHLEVVRLLLDKGADISVRDKYGATSLNCASANSHLEVVRLLLNNGADSAVPDYGGWTPLNVSSCLGHVDVVKLLLDTGADLMAPSTTGWIPIQSALIRGHLEVVRLLLEGSANIDAPEKGRQNGSPLSFEGLDDSQIIQRAIATLPHGTNYNGGWSMLHWACRTADFSLVNVLLESGMEQSTVTTTEPPGQWTPYDIAMFHQNKKLVPEQNEAESTVRSSSRLRLPDPRTTLIAGEKRDGFYCDGCLHVRLDYPQFKETC